MGQDNKLNAPPEPISPASLGSSQVSILKPRRDSKFARLFAEAQAIEQEDAFEAGEVAYINRIMVQATLPYREPKGDPPAWGRRAGDWSLIIQPGMYIPNEATVINGTESPPVPVSVGYPYGSTPRLILAWLGREIKRQGSNEIKLGDHLNEFLLDLGVENATGGRRGTITIAYEQMRRLFSSRIALVKTSDHGAAGKNWNMDSMQVADHQALWRSKVIGQPSLFESTVTLSQRFYEEFANHGVPLDMRALRALRQSPMALDLYCWLTYRMHILRKTTTISWEALQLQFGSETENIRRFRSHIREHLKSVQTVYPAAKIDSSSSTGLILMPSPTAVRSIGHRFGS